MLASSTNPSSPGSEIRISVDRGQARRARMLLENAGLSPRLFLEWKQIAEFEISESPGEKLYPLSRPRTYEYKHRVKVDGERFKLIWEFEWNRRDQVLPLVEFGFEKLSDPLAN